MAARHGLWYPVGLESNHCDVLKGYHSNPFPPGHKGLVGIPSMPLPISHFPLLFTSTVPPLPSSPENFKQGFITTRIQVIIWKQEGQASHGKAGTSALAEEDCERCSQVEAATWGQRIMVFWILDA